MIGRALLLWGTDGSCSVSYQTDEAIIACGHIEFWWEPDVREIRTRVRPFEEGEA